MSHMNAIPQQQTGSHITSIELQKVWKLKDEHKCPDALRDARQKELKKIQAEKTNKTRPLSDGAKKLVSVWGLIDTYTPPETPLVAPVGNKVEAFAFAGSPAFKSRPSLGWSFLF